MLGSRKQGNEGATQGGDCLEAPKGPGKGWLQSTGRRGQEQALKAVGSRTGRADVLFQAQNLGKIRQGWMQRTLVLAGAS